MAMEEGLSIADALAMSRDNDGLFGGGSGGILALIIVFILLFGGNGMWGGARENYATQGEVQRSFDTNTIVNKLDGIANGLCSSGYENAQLINGVNMSIMNQTNQLGQGISNLGYEMQNCCCANGREADRNTRDILEAICADGQATRALITENEITRLRTDLQSAQLALSNANQTQNILTAMGRYVTNPPCYYNYGGVTVA